MKKFHFANLAFMLSCISTSAAYAQYPGAYGSLAPSSFPAPQQRVQPNYQPFPQVPQSGAFGQVLPGNTVVQRNQPFQLTATQEVVPTPAHQMPAGAQSFVPSPVPMQAPMQPAPMQGAPQSIVEGGVQHSMQPQYQGAVNAPLMNPVYGQAIAPGCTSCGSAPLTESYAYSGAPFSRIADLPAMRRFLRPTLVADSVHFAGPDADLCLVYACWFQAIFRWRQRSAVSSC